MTRVSYTGHGSRVTGHETMKTKIKNLLFILILGSACTLLLVGFRGYTMPRIERYHEMMLKSTIIEAAGIRYKKDVLEDAFKKYIRKMNKDGFTYYLSPDDLYIFIFEGRGLWGMITGAITMNPDLTTIENLRIISQEETPGLGGRISEEGFLKKFREKRVSPRLVMMLRTKAARHNEIDAITGASMTSQALIDMINESVIDFRTLMNANQ